MKQDDFLKANVKTSSLGADYPIWKHSGKRMCC